MKKQILEILKSGCGSGEVFVHLAIKSKNLAIKSKKLQHLICLAVCKGSR